MSQPILQLSKDMKRHQSIFDIEANATMLGQLMEMGFERPIAEQALINTKNRNLQAAMDWILEHPNGISPNSSETPSNFQLDKPSEGLVADSTTTATPPNESVKKEEKIVSRLAPAEAEKKRHLEKVRQQELEKLKKEKIEKEKEKERVKKMMEEDRLERLRKTSHSTASSTPTSTSLPAPSSTPTSTSSTIVQNCVLQIRLPSGSTQKVEFKSDTTLRTVHSYITQHFTNHDSSFNLITTFPKKEFKDNMLDMTLQQADLAPRGVLLVQMIVDKGVIKKYEAPIDDSTINTDAMSYEQLLDLEDKVGYVSQPVPQAAKDLFPTRIFDEKEALGKSRESIMCTICQCEYEHKEVIRQLPCTHEFHKDCVDQWLNTHHKCPLCKQDL